MPIPMTRDDALARLASRKRDQAFVQRYRDGGTASPEFGEMQQLQAAAIGVDAPNTDAFNPSSPLSPAAQRIAVLKGNSEWVKRYREGGTASPEFKELQNLLGAA